MGERSDEREGKRDGETQGARVRNGRAKDTDLSGCTFGKRVIRETIRQILINTNTQL